MLNLLVFSFIAALLLATPAARTTALSQQATGRTSASPGVLKSGQTKPPAIVATSSSSTASSVCHPYYQSGCPRGWFLADTNLCLTREDERKYWTFYKYGTYCEITGGNLLNETDITTNLLSCLQRYLPENEDKKVLLSNNKILNVLTHDVKRMERGNLGYAYILCALKQRQPVYCGRQDGTACPRGWVLADRDTCLHVTYPGYSKRAGETLLVDVHRITALKECILEILWNLGPLIYVNETTVLDLGTNTFTSRYPNSTAFSIGIMNATSWDRPTITAFKLDIMTETLETIRQEDLLGIHGIVMPIGESEDILKFTCQTSGSSQTTVKLLGPKSSLFLPVFGTDSLETDVHDSATLEVRNASCADSGFYVCQASNLFDSVTSYVELQIKDHLQFVSFEITKHRQYGDMPFLAVGHTAELYCSTVGCPYTKVVSIRQSHHLELCRAERSNVSYLLYNVSCSDMGPYVCQAEGANGEFLQREAEMVIDGRCPVQLCRGELEPKMVSAALGEAFNTTVCLISNLSPSFVRQPQDKKVSVTFTRKPLSRVVFQALITIPNISHTDYRTYTLTFRNIYGLFKYNFTLIHEGIPTCATDVKATSKGKDYIMLSWRHEVKHPSYQPYHVFFSSNNKTWSHWRVKDGASSANITGLAEDTNYSFRVAAPKLYYGVVEEPFCNITVVFKTAANDVRQSLDSTLKEDNPEAQAQSKTSTHRESSSLETKGFLKITVPVIAANVFIVATFAVFLYWKRARHPKTSRLTVDHGFDKDNNAYETNSFLEHRVTPDTPTSSTNEGQETLRSESRGFILWSSRKVNS